MAKKKIANYIQNDKGENMKYNVQQKTRLENLTNFLWEQIIIVNSSYDICILLSKSKSKYPKAMTLSPAFYSINFKSCIDSCLSTLTRLYDKNGNSTIITLLTLCEDNPDLIVAIQNEVGRKKATLDHFKLLLIKIRQEYDKLLPLIKKLTKIRDKIVSHNDSKSIESLERILDQNKMTFSNIKLLIDFATEFTQCIIAYLTTIVKQQHAKNINDLEVSLKLLENIVKKDDY